MLRKIGIMQGRLCPERYDRLQVFPDQHWRKEFELANKINFNHIELLFDIEQSEFNPLVNKSFLPELKEISEENSISFETICADYFTEFGFFGETAKTAWEHLDLLIESAVMLGVSHIIIPFFNKNLPTNKNELRDVIEGFSTKINGKENMSISIEIDIKASDIADLTKNVRNISACYDLGNACVSGFDAFQDLMMLKELISIIHIKDKRRITKVNVPLGEGDVNFQDLLKFLNTESFSGIFTLETALGIQAAVSAKSNLKFIENYVKNF